MTQVAQIERVQTNPRKIGHLVFREIEGVEINPHKIGHASSWPVRFCEGLVIGLTAFGSWLIQLVNERKRTTFFQRLNHFWNHCVSIDFGLHF